MQNKKQLKVLIDLHDKLDQLEIDFQGAENAELFEEKRECVLLTLEEMRGIITADESAEEN